MSKAIRRLTLTHSPLSPAVRTRLELATPCVTGRYSNQLNYRTNFHKIETFHKVSSKLSPNQQPLFPVCECKVIPIFQTVQVFRQLFFIFFNPHFRKRIHPRLFPPNIQPVVFPG